MLLEEGIAEGQQWFLREADLRYSGQSFELKIAMPEGPVTSASMESLERAFHRAHEQTYGHAAPGEPVDIVNLRLIAVGSIPKPRPPQIGAASDGLGSRKAERAVCFYAANGFVQVAVYDRYKLPAGVVLEGPCIVEEFDSTIVVHPGVWARVDEFGAMHITRGS